MQWIFEKLRLHQILQTSRIATAVWFARPKEGEETGCRFYTFIKEVNEPNPSETVETTMSAT